MRKQKVSIQTQTEEGVFDLAVLCENHKLTYNVDLEIYRVTFVNGVDEDDDARLLTQFVISKRAFLTLAVTEDTAYIQALADEAEAGYDPNKLTPRRTFGTVNLVIGRDDNQ